MTTNAQTLADKNSSTEHKISDSLVSLLSNRLTTVERLETQNNFMAEGSEKYLSVKMKNLLAKYNCTVDVVEQKHKYFVSNPLKLAGVKELIELSVNDITIMNFDLGDDAKETIVKVLQVHGHKLADTLYWPIYTDKKNGKILYTIHPMSSVVNSSFMALAGFAFITKDKIAEVWSEWEPQERINYAEKQLKNDLIQMQRLANNQLVTITLRENGEAIDSEWYVNKNEHAFSQTITRVISGHLLRKSLREMVEGKH